MEDNTKVMEAEKSCSEVSIAKALKIKNRIIGQMNDIWGKIRQNHSCRRNVPISESNPIEKISVEEQMKVAFSADAHALLDNWRNLHKELIEVKAAISRANTPIVDLLVSIQEAKAELKTITDGIVSGTNEATYCSDRYASVCLFAFSDAEKDEMIANLKRTINQLQDSIDEYNATHRVSIKSHLLTI